MINGDRTKRFNAITRQIRYCRDCLDTLKSDLDDDVANQDKDPFDSWRQIRNHSRYANDIIYIRRQMLKLEKMLREG